MQTQLYAKLIINLASLHCVVTIKVLKSALSRDLSTLHLNV